MKKEFLNYLRNSLDSNTKLLAMNSISEEDKAAIQTTIDNLNATIEAVDALPEENPELVDELKATMASIEEQITAIKEKIESQKNEEPQMAEDENMENTNYLSTANSVKDFCNIVRNSHARKDFIKNWNEVLVQNGITIAEGSEAAFLPEAVKGKIADLWDRNADWLKDLNNVGAKRYQVRKNDSEQTNANSRAKGFKKGDTKTAQSLQFSAKAVECQFIFKIQELSLEDEWNDDGAMLDYILKELVDQILYEMKRAILIGDGRANDATGKINKIEAIAKSSADAYTAVSSVTENGFLVDDMRIMVDAINNPNSKPVYVFMNKADLRTLSRVQASSTSTPVYLSTEQVAEQIGATKIITTDLLGGVGATYTAIAMIPSEYVLIGDGVLNPALYTWHEGYSNLNVYRYEVMAGGAIEGLLSTSVLKA